ncbi:MAG TPA: NmrA/HSCARG family protein [Bryobacteraceae bacterium]
MPDHRGRLILVTGATGRQGGAALRHLLERGFSIRAATRDPEKPAARQLAGRSVEVVRADLNDNASIARALDGVYGVYSVQNLSQGLEAEVRQGKNLIDAANRARITHFVYSSVGAADKHTGIPHFDSKASIEEHLRASGIAYTIVRPVFFMENWLGMKSMIDGGAIAWPLSPEKRLQMIAVDDIGGFVAMAFEHPGRWQGRAIDIAGDELSMSAIAQAFTKASGREVRYQQIPWEPFEQRAGAEMTTMFRWFENTGYDVDISTIRSEYPNLMNFARWLNAHWAKAQAAAE